ncbi:phage minor capsid protein [Hominenteromicrobium sp.]|uniref:phage minor capsid protein n=1 Tax=Hominenteromicrobium sp. TaxID=3073581 RepID=UPI003A8FB165
MRSVIRMLTPDYLEHCADAVILLYQRLDEAIARDIARRLMKMGEVTDTARWQAEQLQHAGRLYDEVIAEVARYSGMTQEAVRKAFEDAGVKSMDAEIEQYLQAGINVPPIRQNERAWNILQAALKKTGGELLNLTMTTALETQQRFISACTLAEIQVTGGFLSYQEAVRRAIRDAAGEGTSVLYPSGHVDKLDVAVRRAVVTGVNQTCGKITESLADEFECDLMEITAHAGARPSHAVWQGQIVSRSGRRGYLSLSDIGYGTGAGFQGWNCRHSWNPFFEGISKRSYTKEDIEALNAKDVPYNGGMYTEYEISQMQRRMEREIRATRRELAGLDEAAKFSTGKQKADLQSDFAQSSVKLKRQEAKLRDFTRQTDRRVDISRVQVMGFGRSVSQKAAWENKKEKPIFDLLSAHGVKYKQRINRKEIIVDAGKPKIVGMRVHAAENLTTKADRAQMSLEQAQLFVNNAKLTLYQDDKFTMKFLAEDGYAVLNFDYELVTAVPQKWRKKYDQFLEEMKT